MHAMSLTTRAGAGLESFIRANGAEAVVPDFSIQALLDQVFVVPNFIGHLEIPLPSLGRFRRLFFHSRLPSGLAISSRGQVHAGIEELLPLFPDRFLVQKLLYVGWIDFAVFGRYLFRREVGLS